MNVIDLINLAFLLMQAVQIPEVQIIILQLSVYRKRVNEWDFPTPLFDSQVREVPANWLREFTTTDVSRIMEPHPVQLATIWQRTGWLDEEETILPLVGEERGEKTTAYNNMVLSDKVRALRDNLRITDPTANQYG